MRTAAVVVAAVVASGCGRIDFEDLTDAGADTSCVLGPWSAPQDLVEINSTDDESGPALSANGLELVFAVSPVGTGVDDLFVTTRPDLVSPFGTPTALANVNTTFDEADPALSHDGLTLFFSSNRGGMVQLYAAGRATPTGDFGAPALIAPLATMSLGGPSASADGSELFVTTRGSTGRGLADVTELGNLSMTITELAELETSAYNGFPTISGDGLTVYWESDALVQHHIFVASRPVIGAPFGTGTAVPEFDDPQANDGDPEISFDGRTMIISRTTGADNDLYLSTRACQ